MTITPSQTLNRTPSHTVAAYGGGGAAAAVAVSSSSEEQTILRQTSGSLAFRQVATLDAVPPHVLQTAISVYQTAFAEAPYFELYSEGEVRSIFEEVLEKQGDLILGVEKEDTCSLAAGYTLPNSNYYIAELAVAPPLQGHGYGRATFTQLLQAADRRHPPYMEIRTANLNDRAISLYQKAGFVQESGLETVAALRQDGTIGLHEGVYLSKPAMTEEMRLKKLKHVAVVYPSGNTTAVVFDKLLGCDRKALNRQVTESWTRQHPDAFEVEQCCFVVKPTRPEAMARVEMFGGEFCGNATRSVIWLLTKGANYEGLIEVSGVVEPLHFSVQGKQVSLEMPLPLTGQLTEIVDEGMLVHLNGITHLVVTQPSQHTPREMLQVLQVSNKYRFSSYPAFGVSYFDPSTRRAQFCVWVNAVDTIYDETACGSGTCSIGIALATDRRASVEQEVIQPSDRVISTRAAYSTPLQRVCQSTITGEVEVLYDGEFELG